MFELLQMVKHLAAVERLDVPRLRRRETPNRPAEMHEVRLHRMRERVHPDLLWKPVSFARVARTARGDDVRPVVRPAARQWHEVVARQCLTRLELRDVASAILATIVIAREQECVRDLASEPARHVDELGQPNDRRARHSEPLGSHDTVLVRLDNLGFAVDHEAKGPAHRDHRQRFV